MKTRKKEFEFEYNPVNSNFSYVVLAGDNQSVTQSVRAVDRPRVDNMDIEYEYPAYISDTKSERKRDTQISGVVGTKATITVIANKPLDEAQVKFGNDQPVVIRDFSADKKTFIANVTLDASKDYDITLLDTDRLDNSKNKTRYKITVKNDTVPRITWKRPATDLEVTPQAIVSLGPDRGRRFRSAEICDQVQAFSHDHPARARRGTERSGARCRREPASVGRAIRFGGRIREDGSKAQPQS